MVGTPVSENPSSQLFLEWDISKKMDKQTHENVQEDFSVIHQQNVRFELIAKSLALDMKDSVTKLVSSSPLIQCYRSPSGGLKFWSRKVFEGVQYHVLD